MKSFLLKISSPEGDVFSGNAVNLSVRGTEGELAVMAGHVPFVTAVKPCDCKIELESGEEKTGRIDGGVLTVSMDKAVLLSGSFRWLEQ
ncbi:MAG: F0F1 ATP synthase subunit epsilon [Ruminococcaceae bacterium]|nr:F0F1 ATP synthase subunit epsilon [Oscillospiraceae bacterium]